MTCPLPILALLLLAPLAHADAPLPPGSFAEAFGSYGPGGDCSTGPRIVVAPDGLEITVDGHTDRVSRPDVSWTYFGPAYEGIARAVFPYTGGERPVVFLFNEGEVPQTLRVDGFDRGWKGGPPLSPRRQALVDGSPYAACES
ncbi:hypothetical protein [Marilutibacter aestuarii]|uniref:Uncharacterized protein n=1 Tax=Marilutibacter aestuarii TaxID=1706195 RepID=A0A508A2P9_9GAMM|nr:hypothetical protein [Lysobacter aestuarii]TQD43587.1 hypothetical protein FKV25_10160 [Lysobacter aestuarii]